MKYSFAIGIPTLNRADLLNPTLEKYFQQFPDVEIFIVNNGDKQITSRSKNFTIHKPDSNYGVAKSWNYLCDQIFKDHEYALILNDDIEINLNQDELNNFLINQKFNIARCQESYHLSSFALSKECFLNYRFDEDFYPAYFEDRDYLYRLKLNNGIILQHNFLNPSKFINSATISPNGGDPKINSNFRNLQNLYMKKWGGPPGLEKFITPYQSSHDEVTFIIPTLNRPSLTNAVNSIKSQTNQNWKSIIIYDGIEPTENFQDQKIKTLHTQKLGRITDSSHPHNEGGLVRNVGLQSVDTTWTAFLDDDDTITPNYVDLLLSKYSQFDLVIFRMYCTKNNAIIPRPNNNQIMFGNVGISFAFKTPKEPILFPKNHGGEDFEFVKHLIDKGYNYTITDEVCYKVRH